MVNKFANNMNFISSFIELDLNNTFIDVNKFMIMNCQTFRTRSSVLK